MMAAKRLGLKLTNIHVPADNPDLNLEEETARLKDVLAFMDTVDTVLGEKIDNEWSWLIQKVVLA